MATPAPPRHAAPSPSLSSDPGPGDGPIRLGPFVRWRGERDEAVVLDVTVAGARPSRLTADASLTVEADGAFEAIGQLAGTMFWSARMTAPSSVAGPVRYRLDGDERTLHLPGRGGALRLAFASCNGAEDEASFRGVPGGRNALWRDLAARHEGDPFHLLALGGDQIYADALWDLSGVRAWAALPRRRRHAAPFTDALRRELEEHYLATYARAFGDLAVADVLARVPSLMVWDDHDIVDGWGSRPDAWQESPFARGLFEAARRAFCLVQLGLDPDRHAAPYGWHAAHGCALLVVPDLRSERTRRRVMAPEGHQRLDRAIGAAREPHALVISSVPLVNADLSPVERLVAPVQPLADLYQDDLRDQWMSYRHRAEWAGVVRSLHALARRGPRVSVLSGEIHLGAHGTAAEDGAVVEQFIASGIAHPAPPRALARGYETFAGLTRHRAGIDIAMRPVAPDGRRYVAERNWLEVTARPDGALDATLHAERSGALPLSRGQRREDA